MNLSIKWKTLEPIDINLNNNEVSAIIYSKFKYLQHLELDFNETLRDNPFGKFYTDIDFTTQQLTTYARQLGFDIDQELTQDYLNHLHEIYEINYHKNPIPLWLQFHEAIHQIESHKRDDLKNHPIVFDYREKAGLLEVPLDRKFLKYKTTTLKKGDCYVKWQELSKDPYTYFKDKEPDDIVRLKELAKPWLLLRPTIRIATADREFYNHIDLDAFLEWFQPYREDWCNHWNIVDWDPMEMFSVITIGSVTKIDQLCLRFKNNQFPYKISPQ